MELVDDAISVAAGDVFDFEIAKNLIFGFRQWLQEGVEEMAY